MPNVAPTLGARLAASLARLVTRSVPASEAPAQKASRTGPLIAFQSMRQPVWAPRDYAAFANEGFMQNAIVYRCVRMIAECAAHVPLLVYEGDEERDDHPLRALIRKPNAHEAWPEFMQKLVGFLLVSGNAYIEAVAVPDAQWASEGTTGEASEGARIRELHLLRPDRVKVVPGPDGWPEAFDYTVGGRTVRIGGEVSDGVRSVLHVKLFHPTNDHYGLSPLEAAASAIDLHNTASKWNKALLDNSARPSGAIVYTARDGNLSGEQIERLKSELEAGFQGSANAGRPLLLEGGLDWKAMSLSPKDMDFIEARHVAAREIALALGVPPMLLGVPGDNTYSNLAEAQRTFWRSTVLPLVERVASQLSLWLGPAFRDPVELRVDIDTLPALASEREALWASLEKTSFLTDAEKRTLAGFTPEPAPDAKRFNPNQPRIPSGQPGGGQWTNGEGGDSGGFGPGGLGGREPSLLDLVGGRGGPLSPEAIRSLYRDFGGHHVAPLADTLRRSDMLTSDAIDVLSSRTIGGGGPLSDQKDASNPHRGRTAEHRAYEQATRELTDKFIADNKIDSKNPMTREQANRLADSIERSKDPRIERFLQSIRRYIDDSRRRGGRFRGGRGGRGE